MPKLSNKAVRIPASAIRKLTPFANAAKRDGVKVYHLNIGAPDIKSPQSAVDALKNFQMEYLPYSDSAGTIELRRAMVEKYYRKIGIGITTDEILVNTAGSEAVDFTVQTCCDPGDEIIVIEPYYTNYFSFAFQNGIVVKPVHTDIHEGFKVPSIEAFEAVCTPRTKAVLLCNPGNPTGVVYSREDMLQIGEFCRRHDLFLISDEVYREFCYRDEPHFSALNIPGLEQNVIMVDSVSKRYNLCGARIGCVVSHTAEVIAAITKLAQARLCPPVLGQAVTLGALDAPQSYFDKTREEYIRRRDFTLAALNSMEGVFSPVPEGAFYTIAELPVENAEDFARWMLTDFRLDSQTVMVTPAASFYCTPGVGLNQIRIAYVLEVPELEKAMKVLEEGLKAYRSR